MSIPSKDKPWEKIFNDYNLHEHDFDDTPVKITAPQIKVACQDFKKTAEKEVRVLCYQATRETRPQVFIERGLFLLPVKNGEYYIVKGEGYIDIPEVKNETEVYSSKLDFNLDTSQIGDSEMQHLDFAYASSLIRTFMKDDSLVLTIRGRKYTPKFKFRVGKHELNIQSVQTEVDAGYEGRNQVALIEGKNSKMKNTIIRQLYYPFRQWQNHTQKRVIPLFFEKLDDTYLFWKFEFGDIQDYNSIQLVKSAKYRIV